MKKAVIFLAFLFLIGINAKSEARFDLIKDIINNQNLSEEQKLKEVKNIPYEKKLELLNEIGNTAGDSKEADILIEFLYGFNLNSYNDIESVDDYIAFVRFLYAQSPESIEFYKKRLKQDNYNIFWESVIADTLSRKATGDLSFASYDEFNKKLNNGTFNFKNKSDRKFFIALMDYLDIADYDENYDDEEDEYKKPTIEDNQKLMETLNDYFNRSEFKNYKIKNSYHIYRLGLLIVENFNKNSEEFISKKIKDKNTNLENLCYFLKYIKFDSKISAEVEKEFNEGFYNSTDKPLKIFTKNTYIANISSINGEGNKIIQTIKANKIPLTPNDRLKISYMSQVFQANLNTDYQDMILKKIKNIASSSNTKNKSAEVMTIIEKYYSKANEEYKAREKKFAEKLEKLEEIIEF